MDVREQSQFDLWRHRREWPAKRNVTGGPKICAITKKGASAGEMPANVSLRNPGHSRGRIGELEAPHQSCEALADDSESFALAGAMKEPYGLFPLKFEGPPTLQALSN